MQNPMAPNVNIILIFSGGTKYAPIIARIIVASPRNRNVFLKEAGSVANPLAKSLGDAS
jgi:hypothetical protein